MEETLTDNDPLEKRLYEENMESSPLGNLMRHFKIPDRSFLPYPQPKTQKQRSINASEWLFLIAEMYNEGWVPNWSDINEQKWYAYKAFSGSSWVVYVSYDYYYVRFPSGLYFKSKEAILDALAKFPEVFDDYFMV